MDYNLELEFQKLTKRLNEQFDADLDVQAILFLIGVQELGQGYDKYSKQEKTELMHVAVCTLLEPYGHYKFVGRDSENWPHFEKIDDLPYLDERQQQHLIKEAILDYFKAEQYDF
ncbi:hypothetical protein SAMN05216474_2988 [Lishizhenia tianjinensis]|uniref:Uncharacterized protein n=1 Tax=Lishizhenia tianjinensis TaxID=477690 RepID=A0A1I7BQ85_9FLAO|nr:hypothetical protein [Lishizhenia tianjinensis]SFT89301.1 hypothetical protein SAMN05216474_2988 [Lishizhenia tianjinensis]